MKKPIANGSSEPEYVEFNKLAAVGWFSLRLLGATGLRAFVTALIGERTGRREILAALDQVKRGPVALISTTESGGYKYNEKRAKEAAGIWIDYVADLGDGFDATHSISWLVGRDYVFLKDPEEPVQQPIPKGSFEESGADAVPCAKHILSGGDILIFGGDQCYPYGSQENYRNRTYFPYYAARPWASANPVANDNHAMRVLFSIPSNHDWYDGLGSFIRMFCQPGRWMGCWQVQQSRSYFSVQLPHGFWLWGIDTATEDDIDPPQLAYFEKQAALLGEGHQVILFVPQPSWIDCASQKGDRSEAQSLESWDSWNKISKIEKAVKDGSHGKASVPLLVAGDLHHYSRYSELPKEGGHDRHYITCGGGGAHLLGTAKIPGELRFRDGQRASLETTFPSAETARLMRSGVFKIIFRHKVFCAVIGAIMLALFWLINLNSFQLAIFGNTESVRTIPIEKPLLETLELAFGTWDGCRTFLSDLAVTIIVQPGVLFVILCLVGMFVVFARSGATRKTHWGTTLFWGIFHFLAQFCVTVILVGGTAVVLKKFDASLFLSIFFYSVFAVLTATIFNGLTLAAYIRLSNMSFGLHEQELYSSQAIEDWKCFLRMHVTREGLTVYPVGLRKIENRWTQEKQTLVPRDSQLGQIMKRIANGIEARVQKGTTHLFVPGEPLSPELIEKPIFIKSTSGVKT